MFKQQDINKLFDLLKQFFLSKVDANERFERLEQKINHLPTKEDFFSRMDALTGEIKAVREVQELHAHDHSRIDKRVHRVEKTLKIPSIAD